MINQEGSLLKASFLLTAFSICQFSATRHFEKIYSVSLFDDIQEEQKEKRKSSSQDRTYSTASSVKKPYGDSWFSPEAHRSVHKLREEYRALAKRYHPDVCKRTDSKEIFQDILNEQAQLLETME